MELYSKVPVHVCGEGYGDINLIDMSYTLHIKAMYTSKIVALIHLLLYNTEDHNVHLLPSWNIKPYNLCSFVMSCIMLDFTEHSNRMWAELCSSGLLYSKEWQFLNNISGQPIDPETSVKNCHCLLCNSQKKVVLRVMDINLVRTGRKWLLLYSAVHLPFNIR